MITDIISNAVQLQLLEETYTAVLKGENPLDVRGIQREIESLERESQYRDFFSLFEIAEYRYRLGILYHRLALATKDPTHLTKAKDAFRFVLASNYRTRTCTTAFLDWLIHDSPRP